MNLTCQSDPRRDAVRRQAGRNGLDYVEAGGADAPLRLYAIFLGKLPPELATRRPGIERHLRIEGGEAITGVQVLRAVPQVNPDPTRDDVLVLEVDRCGDFSPYTLRLVDVEGIDPRYASAAFTFHIDCANDLDCAAACDCTPAPLDEPSINYLAKDYASFRQLILDRLALLMPGWTERHVPDLGITLVELLAYVGDQLSYYQDAVATEAYIGTARQRISVRRHARLVDYALNEGCNARGWLQLIVTEDLDLATDQIGFATGMDTGSARQPVLTIEEFDDQPLGSCQFYEPLVAGAPVTLHLRAAHNRMSIYTWGRRECCLAAGASSATLLDHWVAPPVGPNDARAQIDAKAPPPLARALDLRCGDVLVFEEVRGARTGAPPDADPLKRWAVRLTEVRLGEDTLYPVSVGEGDAAQTLATPIVEVRWSVDDALPFALCVSAIGTVPDCQYLTDITIVSGNVILVDHGRTVDPEPLPPVPTVTGQACCECEGEPGEVQTAAGRYRPALAQSPVVHAEPLPHRAVAASRSLVQRPCKAVPEVSLVDAGGAGWTARPDLLASGPDDRDFVVEIDNAGAAHLRFGDGELGRGPDAGPGFEAAYRVGGGSAGNVGAEAISRLVLRKLKLGNAGVTVRNPLPASGGLDPEPMEQARLFAPAAFRHRIERAITAADYAELAQRNPALQRASARLEWSGSWYEADVAIDPLGTEQRGAALEAQVDAALHRYRRMGHDLRVQSARYVPLKLRLRICVLPGYDRGHVKAALLARFSNRINADRQHGFFHPDELNLGEPVRLSRIVAAAQAVSGVECARVTEFHRLFAGPSHELDNGVLPLASNEVAQLDNDPNHPERGALLFDIDPRTGR